MKPNFNFDASGRVCTPDSCGRVIADNIAQVVVGKQNAVSLLLTALIGEGHILLEDVPGVGKTLLAKALAKSIGGLFKRIQFTPDLLPADITGFNVFDPSTGRFRFQPGPLHCNVLLADEINRTIPRTQSSLLESMEERQVTVDGETLFLPEPFFVLATQNPIELEGTFPLPEAQLDRFLLKVRLGYPDRAEEISILSRFQESDPLNSLENVVSLEEILDLRKRRRKIRVSTAIREYVADIVRATRSEPDILYGASPRGSLGLMRASQARALILGRDFVLPDDVKYLAEAVLCHRLILSPEARLQGRQPEELIQAILQRVPVPLPGV